MTNFYVSPQDVAGEKVLFRAAEAKHLCSVCRKKVGDIINAVDGQGNEYAIVLEQVSPRSAAGSIIRRRRKSREPVVRLTLAQAISKGGKLDLVIQKGTELGAHRFLPMITEHTVVAPEKLSAAKRQERWQKIAISAMKQSLRSHLPQVAPLASFDHVLKEVARVDTALLATVVQDAKSLDRIFSERQSPRDVLLLVGPEGGFSAEEIHRAMQAGVELVSLGPRRLRSETAGVIFVGVVLFKLGEMG